MEIRQCVQPKNKSWPPIMAKQCERCLKRKIKKIHIFYARRNWEFHSIINMTMTLGSPSQPCQNIYNSNFIKLKICSYICDGNKLDWVLVRLFSTNKMWTESTSNNNRFHSDTIQNISTKLFTCNWSWAAHKFLEINPK